MLTIEQLRKKIEETDTSIIEKIAEREELSKQIGQLKLAVGANVIDHSREEILFEIYMSLCEKHKLPHIFITELFKMIINHSRKIQESRVNLI